MVSDLIQVRGTQLSKLGKMQCQDKEAIARDVKADDLRQMFLAMTEEVSVFTPLPLCKYHDT